MLFFFNDTATTEIYTLSLHDALPIYPVAPPGLPDVADHLPLVVGLPELEFYLREPLAQPLLYIFKCQNAIDLWPACPQCAQIQDRKSTRLNSSHANISYAVFCLKKKI